LRLDELAASPSRGLPRLRGAAVLVALAAERQLPAVQEALAGLIV
jgi:hypothetical protein